MAIKEELIELNSTKQGIKNVFQEKGVDLTGKAFTDTPDLIREMNVSRGDEIEAFPIGEAKSAKENDKVILNYAADMMPGEPEVTGFDDNSRYEYGYGLYVDKSLMYTGYIYATGASPAYYERKADGTYAYSGYSSGTNSQNVSTSMYMPYGVWETFGRRGICVLNGKTANSYRFGSNNSFAVSQDYKFFIHSGHAFKLIDNHYILLNESSWSNSAPSGIIEKDNNYYIIQRNSTNSSDYVLNTYSLNTDTGEVTFVGAGTQNGFSSTMITYWRYFGSNKAIISTSDAANPAISNLVVVTLSEIDNVYSITKDETLTAQLLTFLNETGVVGLSQVVNWKSEINIWDSQACCRLKYDEASNSFLLLPNVFPDFQMSTGRLFINPIDRIAAFMDGDKSIHVRELDAPIQQSYVATKADESGSLSFQSISLTGFVKENNDGILKVATVLDPNAVAPTYPDAYGLNVTINAGTANADIAMPYGAGESLSNASDMSFFGFMPKSQTKFSKIQISGRSSGASSTTDKYLKLFIWDEVQNSYTFISCSKNTQRLDTGSTALWEFDNEQTLLQDAYYGFAFSTNNTADWSGLVCASSSVQASESSTDFKLMFSISKNNPPSSNNYAFIPVFSFIYHGVDEGDAGISWGWFKGGDEYIKYPGGTAKFSDVSGAKTTTMGLWLVKSGETVKPVISVADPVSYAIRHKLQDVFLSDTLDYFVNTPPESAGV